MIVPWLALLGIVGGTYGLLSVRIDAMSLQEWQQRRWGWNFLSPTLHVVAVLVLLSAHAVLPHQLGLTVGHWATAPLAIVTAVVVIFGGAIVLSNRHPTTKALSVRFPGWSTTLYQGLFVPIAEELFWRGYFQAQVGIWIAAATFGVAHASNPGTATHRLGGVLYAGTLGILFGYLRLSTGGIVAGILLHAFVNVLNHCTLPDLAAAPSSKSA